MNLGVVKITADGLEQMLVGLVIEVWNSGCGYVAQSLANASLLEMTTLSILV